MGACMSTPDGAPPKTQAPAKGGRAAAYLSEEEATNKAVVEGLAGAYKASLAPQLRQARCMRAELGNAMGRGSRFGCRAPAEGTCSSRLARAVQLAEPATSGQATFNALHLTAPCR